MINFRKLLPKRLQSSTWADIIESSENFLKTEVKDNYIDPKYYSFPYYFNANTAELLTILTKSGDDYSTYDGYTVSDEFYLRRIYTLEKRRQHRKLPIGYEHVLFIYTLTGIVYPLLNLGSSLYAWEEYYDIPESYVVYINLDTGWTLDSGYTLDNFEYYNQLTNHFIIEYEYTFVENTTEFLSENTMLALWKDVNAHKKIVEVPHFEAGISVYANVLNPIGSPLLTNYTDYSHTLSVNQSTYYNAGALTNYDTIEFSLNGGDIQTFTIGTDFEVVLDTTIGGQQQLVVKQIITWDTKLLTFNEITLYDNTSTIIVKATLPTVNFHSNMLTSARVKFYLD